MLLFFSVYFIYLLIYLFNLCVLFIYLLIYLFIYFSLLIYLFIPFTIVSLSIACLRCSGSNIKYYQGKANMDWTGLLNRISQNPTKFWNGMLVFMHLEYLLFMHFCYFSCTFADESRNFFLICCCVTWDGVIFLLLLLEFSIRCFSFRAIEWISTVDGGWNILVEQPSDDSDSSSSEGDPEAGDYRYEW
jgi:hypothetical protein